MDIIEVTRHVNRTNFAQSWIFHPAHQAAIHILEMLACGYHSRQFPSVAFVEYLEELFINPGCH